MRLIFLCIGWCSCFKLLSRTCIVSHVAFSSFTAFLTPFCVRLSPGTVKQLQAMPILGSGKAKAKGKE